MSVMPLVCFASISVVFMWELFILADESSQNTPACVLNTSYINNIQAY